FTMPESDILDRVQGYMITPTMLGVLLREGAAMRCMVGVPADAQFLDAYPHMASRTIIAVFRHRSFDPVPEGEMIPINRRVMFEILDDPSAPFTGVRAEQIGAEALKASPYEHGYHQ